jgi:hypothetical protein
VRSVARSPSGFADSSWAGACIPHIGYAATRAQVHRAARSPSSTGAIERQPVAHRNGLSHAGPVHVDGSRVGFTAGTALCDAAATRQVSDAGLAAVSSAVSGLAASGARSRRSAGQRDARQRCSLTLDDVRRVPDARWEAVNGATGVTGWAAQDAVGAGSGRRSVDHRSAGRTDDGPRRAGRFAARAEAFFPGEPVSPAGARHRRPGRSRADGAVLDLYAGVRLFSVTLAAGRRDIRLSKATA